MTTSLPPAPDETATAPAAPRRARWRTVIAAVALLLVGIGIGTARGGDETAVAAAQKKATTASKALARAKADNQKLQERLQTAKTGNATLTGEVAAANKRADGALAAARVKVKREFASQAASFTKRKHAMDLRSAALDRREHKVSGMEHAWAANTIPGDGVYQVGSDIQPGTYKAAASPGCYYARLSSLDTSDIIDNNNVDGPVVIQVGVSDAALELSGCSDFHKVG